MDKSKEIAKAIELSFVLFVIICVIYALILPIDASNKVDESKEIAQKHSKYMAFCSKYERTSDWFDICYDCLNKQIDIPKTNRKISNITIDVVKTAFCFSVLNNFLFPHIKENLSLDVFLNTKQYKSFKRGDL